MSRIPDLGDFKSTDIKEKYKNLGTILGQYIAERANVENDIRLKGKSLEVANRENPSLKFYYQQRFVELNILAKFFEREVYRVRGKLFKSLTESNNRDLSDRQKDKYIDNEQAYLDIHEIYI